MTATTTTNITEAAAALRAGKLVAFPTETVYGLGALALDPAAIARVFEAKERPSFDPLIVHVADVDAVDALVTDFSPVARRLSERFWPGPLTLVLPKRPIVPDLVTAGLPTVGIRIPDHPVALNLLREVNAPVAAPSANLFGRTSPTCAEHVVEQLGNRIDLVLDGGSCRVGLESTVLLPDHDPPLVLRLGGVTLEEVTAELGNVEVAGPQTAEQGAQLAPGLLSQHYAPRTPFLLVEDWSAIPQEGRGGILAFDSPPPIEQSIAIDVLSSTGDLREAAANLFASIRRLDAAGLDWIAARLLPEEGLGRAINDRLRRAAA